MKKINKTMSEANVSTIKRTYQQYANFEELRLAIINLLLLLKGSLYNRSNNVVKHSQIVTTSGELYKHKLFLISEYDAALKNVVPSRVDEISKVVKKNMEDKKQTEGAISEFEVKLAELVKAISLDDEDITKTIIKLNNLLLSIPSSVLNTKSNDSFNASDVDLSAFFGLDQATALYWLNTYLNGKLTTSKLEEMMHLLSSQMMDFRNLLGNDDINKNQNHLFTLTETGLECVICGMHINKNDFSLKEYEFIMMCLSNQGMLISSFSIEDLDYIQQIIESTLKQNQPIPSTSTLAKLLEDKNQSRLTRK